MPDRPSSLPDRPNVGAEDPLSEIFRAVRFTRALYYTVTAGGPWPPIRVPAGVKVAKGLGPRTQNVLSYHVVVEGSCFASLEEGAPEKLERGDVVVYPRGDPYLLAADVCRPEGPADPGQLIGILEGVATGKLPAAFAFGSPASERTRFVCGFLGCDPRPFDPLLRALPGMLTVRGTTGRLRHLVELALAEVDGAGGASVRERLSESMFIETIRQYLTTLAPSQAGWLTGLRDAVVGRALALLHGRPAEPWTLASLAKETAVSRSVLADRFTKLVGQPPMQYLTAWRMQAAADLLSQRDAKVAEVASEVGYDSEAAFSRAFKKATGTAPAAWRDGRANPIASVSARD